MSMLTFILHKSPQRKINLFQNTWPILFYFNFDLSFYELLW